MKYLLPWKKHQLINIVQYERFGLKNISNPCFVVFHSGFNPDNNWTISLQGMAHYIEYATAEEAMMVCDKLLINDGWEFIAEERAEKLKLLL